jgi:5-formyltetrahydrofolate cyclo-ligase
LFFNLVKLPNVELKVAESKQRLREDMWNKLERAGVARFPLPISGRIPNFHGSDRAAEKLAELEEWKSAEIVVANPDSPQRKVRELALKGDKTLVMASPRLKRGYLIMEPQKVKGREDYASTIKGAFRLGRSIDIKTLPRVDLVITGCVAVDLHGRRLGKGGGYGDREIGMIREKFGDIAVATTVHELQIVEDIPCEEHDQRIDIIVTPNRVIRVRI